MDNSKRNGNYQVVGIPEGEEQKRGRKLVEEIITKKLSGLWREASAQIQEAQSLFFVFVFGKIKQTQTKHQDTCKENDKNQSKKDRLLRNSKREGKKPQLQVKQHRNHNRPFIQYHTSQERIE